jgi:signal transduction histidine kinase
MRARLRDPRVLDAAMAVVLASWAVLEILTSDTYGSQPVTLAAALLMTLPLAARRRYPLAALAFASAGAAWQGAAHGSVTQTVAPAVAFLILVFTVPMRRTGPAAVLGLLLGLAGIVTGAVLETARGTYHHSAGDYVFASLWVVGVWLFGYALRSRGLRIAGLESETARLAREREERARAAVAAERARIARDLHDVVAHSVSVMVVQAAAAEEVLARDPERARPPLEAIQQTGSQALLEMRRLLGILRATDGALDRGRQPGLADLDALAADFREAGLPVELAVEGDRSALSAGVDLAAYRIVEEALTNALKHSGGASTHVSVRHLDRAVELEVTDEGPGSPGAGAANGGHGLVGMRERAALYGGTFEAGGRDGGGFAVRARLPLDARTPGAAE